MFNLISPLTESINPAYLAEFAATFLLILFGCGSCANASLPKNKGTAGGYFMVVTGWSVGIALLVFVFGRASGAHTNPAITLAFAFMGDFPWRDVPAYIIAQSAGGFVGAICVYLVYFRHFQDPEGDPNNKLTTFCTQPGIFSPFWNCVTEGLGTALLLFMITGLGYAARNGEEQLIDPGFSSLCVGLTILGIGLGLGGPTGFALNPVRDFIPRLAHFLLPIKNKRDSDWRYAWVPIVAPIIGALVGVLVWRILFGHATIPSMSENLFGFQTTGLLFLQGGLL